MNNDFSNIINDYKNNVITFNKAKQLLEQLKGKQENTPEKDTIIMNQRPAYNEESMEIAITGMSGQFPDANNYEIFWENLLKGHDAVRELAGTYVEGLGSSSQKQGMTYHHCGGILEEKYCFDPLFFNIAPVEAESMNPHQRMVLQESWKALEDAAYNPKLLGNSMASIFIGAEPTGFINKSFTGYSDAIIASRLSYFLNLKGPALVVNTGCSSSLVAIHLACKSLRANEASIAIAGGICASLNAQSIKGMIDLGVLSPTGKCRTFDESADGTIFSEGVAIVILKRLEDAIKDGDHIYGVIQGSCINQDGTSNGITAPNGIAQEELIVRVYEKYKINPEEITYIETHGTATKLGDPVEANALVRAYRQFTKKENFCTIGSVKPNIGHTGAASGAIGLLRILLSFRDHKIPGLINFKKLNPLIDFKGSAFHIITRTSEWKSEPGKPLMAAINSFGHSGTNVHMVLREYNNPSQVSVDAPEVQREGIFYLIPFSAREKESLKTCVYKLNEYLKKPDNVRISLKEMAYTLQVGREAMEERLGFTAVTIKELKKKLEAYLAGEEEIAGFYCGQVKYNENTGLLRTDEDLNREMDRWLIKGKYEKILEMWVNGQDIDWNRMYGKKKPQKLSLPGYPFAKEIYRIDKSEASQKQQGASVRYLHPLVQENTSNFFEQKFCSIFNGTEFFLADHVINGQHILPGAAYLEMARSAIAVASVLENNGKSWIRLKNIVWAIPLVVEKEPVKVNIGLETMENGEIGYQIFSETDNGEMIVHSQGAGEIVDAAESAVMDIKALENREWIKKISAQDWYEGFRKTGTDLGPGHRGIENIYVGEDKAFARISMPTTVAENAGEYILHPSMMDAALQTAIGLLAVAGAGRGAIPFALDEVEIMGNCVSLMYALARYSTDGKGKKYNIDLCDESGQVMIRIKGFSLRVMEVKRDQNVLMIEPGWQEFPIIEDSTGFNYSEHLVFLCEPGGKESKIRIKGTQCIILKSKKMKKGIGERYQEFVVKIIEQIRLILKDKSESRVLIQLIVFREGEKGLYKGLMGILMTAQQENPKIIGQLIEVEAGTDSNRLLSIIKENTQNPGVSRIRYKDGKRWKEKLIEFEIPGEEMDIPWKNMGVYLITGGTGGLGHIVAMDIVYKTKDAVIILMGRSKLNSEKKARIKELEKNGAKIEYHQTDVSLKHEVDGLINYINEKYETLNGIIHCAGVTKDSFLLKKSIEEAEVVLNPKVKGTVNLDKGTRDIRLDFFILFSSMSGVGGNIGQADYAAANAFMDAYAKYRNSEVSLKRGYGRTISIDWSQWKDGGMKMDRESEKRLIQHTGMTAMGTDTGIRALYRSVAHGNDQVMVIHGNIKLLREKLLLGNTKIHEETEEDPAMDNKEEITAMDTDSFRDRTVNYLKKLLSSTLKLPAHKIDANAPFEKYGIDSILIMQLTNQLEKVFGTLSKTLFFEYQNLNSLAEYFLNTYHKKLAGLLGSDDKKKIETVKKQKSVGVKTPVKRQRRFLLDNRLKEEKKEAGIAIIGVAGQYPGAKDIEEFWENLRNGKDCITEIPEDRWDWKDYFDEDRNNAGTIYSKWGGFLNAVDKFDPLFFNISPLEAQIIDPQERLFLECAYKTLEDAGYTRKSLTNNSSQGGPGGKVGVYVGVMYEEFQLYGAQEQVFGNMVVLGGSPASIANRVSYFMNFQGPSMAVDTMCSSSLTAIHLACQSLEKGECDAAIAGGVNVSIHPNKYFILSYQKAASSKGRCMSFGKGGDGYVPGEGVGAVLLKPFSRAIEDKDHIYGIIKGSAINAGGKTNGFTVPNPLAQGELIREAIEKAGINARSISYIEAHGTGTSLGDPIEIAGLTKAFQHFTRDKQFCSIGSVKSNIGHCESAAGIASLTKVLLQLKHNKLVPSLHSEELNPNINFSETPFIVQHELTEWKSPIVEIDGKSKKYPRQAGISSFGAGGSNAHIVIEEYVKGDEQEAVRIRTDKPAVIVLSAKKEDRLKELAKNLLDVIEKQGYGDDKLTEIAYTLQVGREEMDERLGFTVISMKEFKEKLSSYVAGDGGTVELFRGQVNQNREVLSSFAHEEILQNVIESWMNKGNYGKLLDMWVKGLNINWNRLYDGLKICRISLPTYPFVKERCWMSLPHLTKKPVTTEKKKNQSRERIIIKKEWHQKNLKANSNNNAGGLVVILGTRQTFLTAGNLFNEKQDIQKVFVIHGNFKKKNVINTDFYSPQAGETLYQQVIDIKGKKKLLGVIDMTALDARYEDSLELESGKIRFVQKLIENNRNEGYHLLQITNKLNNFHVIKTTLQGARLAGLYRMLGAEYRQIVSVTMDCDCMPNENNRLLQQIQTEFFYQNRENVSECCYRNGVRYEPCLTIEKKNDEIAQFQSNDKYEKNEVVLITGGSRGIGAAIAGQMVLQGIKNLVIMGREDLPAQGEWKTILENKKRSQIVGKIRKMQDYVDSGVKVQYYNTSLTDEAGLKKMIQKIHENLGLITGVIHCAGLVGKNPAFFKKEIPSIEQVCEPKIKGLAVLHKVLSNEPLSFFILFSSISALIPTLSAGQGDYAMANSYMDYYSMNQGCQGKGYIKSIQWPAWGETGMGAEMKSIRSQAYVNTGLDSLATNEGLKFLTIIKKIPVTVCTPCTIIPDEFSIKDLLKNEMKRATKKDYKKEKQPELKMKSARIPARASGMDLQASVSLWLIEFFMTELKLTREQVDTGKPFDEYGVDSIIVAQLATTLEKKLKFTISPALFLENRTIKDLSDYFLAHHAEDLQKQLGFEDKIIDEGSEQGFAGQDIESFIEGEEQQMFNNRILQAEECIAVVGLACRFPGASTKEAYWELLTMGKSAIKPVPKKRWSAKGDRKDYAGWVDDIELFDPDFFKIKGTDAAIMDPQARIILEESLNAIYDAGYEHKDLSGKKIGVYVGGRSQPNTDLKAILEANNPILGAGQNYLATNVSRFFNFTGPSIVVDTACSSGITAMSLAADSLKDRRIDMAMIGAVSLILNPFAHEMFAVRNILSKNGEFHIFDKQSGGEVLGEGIGTVLLKRLSDAIMDGNKIYGIIKAIAVNNDGRTLGPGSPNLIAQKKVIQEALKLSGVKIEDVGYIEVNGGGSPVMDSIEIKALSEIYQLNNPKLKFCAIGSIKPNIGHLLLTSGLAGFIRCILSLYHKQIPPFLSAVNPADYYDFKRSRILFNRETINWEVESWKKRIAVQNSFPDGGTNCHVVMEEFIAEEEYEQRFFSIPVPEMRKKHFAITKAFLPDRTEFSGNNEEITITDFKKKFKKKKNDEIEKQPHSTIQLFWGKYED